MAKYTFTLPEKWAVYKVLGPKCIWSKKPVTFDDCEIDHVIPEYIEHKKDEVDKWKEHYGLHADFKINSFYNWIPIKPKRNKTKSKRTFDGAPFLGEVLYDVEKHVPQIIRLHNKWTKVLNKQEVKVFLDKALKDGVDVELIIKDLLNDSTNNSTPQKIINKAIRTIYHSPLDHGWTVVKKSGAIIDVTKDGKYGFMLDLRNEDPNLEFVCFTCLSWGPWNGARCLNCGHLSAP